MADVAHAVRRLPRPPPPSPSPTAPCPLQAVVVTRTVAACQSRPWTMRAALCTTAASRAGADAEAADKVATLPEALTSGYNGQQGVDVYLAIRDGKPVYEGAEFGWFGDRPPREPRRDKGRVVNGMTDRRRGWAVVARRGRLGSRCGLDSTRLTTGAMARGGFFRRSGPPEPRLLP